MLGMRAKKMGTGQSQEGNQGLKSLNKSASKARGNLNVNRTLKDQFGSSKGNRHNSCTRNSLFVICQGPPPYHCEKPITSKQHSTNMSHISLRYSSSLNSWVSVSFAICYHSHKSSAFCFLMSHTQPLPPHLSEQSPGQRNHAKDSDS